MDSLTQVVREEVGWYAGSGRGLNIALFRLFDDQHQTYAVVDVTFPNRSAEDYAAVVVFARVVDDKVVIEQDTTDKPLYKRLVQRGVPETQIICAYAGEPIPDAERFVW